MKLPINPLLYLVSLTAVGGIVHSIYKQIGETQVSPNAENERIASDCAEFQSEAETQQPESRGERYSDRPAWELFRDANFTGKVPKEETAEAQAPEEQETPKDEVDLSLVIDLICITAAGDASGVVLNYVQSVEVPEDKELAPRTATRNIPQGRRGQPNIPRDPVGSTSLAPTHHVMIGDALWPKFDYIYLKSVSADASSVTFELRIEDKKTAAGEYPTQEMQKSQLTLPGSLLTRLQGGGATGADTSPVAGARGTSNQPPVVQWEDPGPKTVIKNNQVHFSREDHTFLETKGAEIFNEDVSMKDYSGGSGENKIRGVQIRKISPRVSELGVQAGDVLLSLNGQPVEGMVAAKQLGRKLYNDGVRSFRAEILRRGQRQTVIYNFEKK